jgi:hypothetical protein
MKASNAPIRYTDEPEEDPRVLAELRREHESRRAISPLTGLAYLKARPGERKVTSEEIYELLKDFP